MFDGGLSYNSGKVRTMVDCELWVLNFVLQWGKRVRVSTCLKVRKSGCRFCNLRSRAKIASECQLRGSVNSPRVKFLTPAQRKGCSTLL